MTTSVIRHLRSFARCSLAVAQIGLMALVLPIVAQMPQRANAAAMTGFTKVTAGSDFTCALKSDSTVWCWGLNSSGQLGDGSTTNRNRPVQVSGLTGVADVDNQSDFACALKSDSTVWCWGNGSFGQLGNGATTNSSLPVRVAGLSGVTQIATGYGHVCAVISDGTVRCWGWNVNHMLGDGTTTSRTTPVVVSGITTATEVRSGAWNTCVLLANQTITCWGNANGFRGSAGSASTKSSPTGISGVTLLSRAHGQHICAKLADESVKCWGYNDHGQVGDGTQIDKNSPVLISSLTGVIGMSSANHTSCAVKSDGTPWCWGWGGFGMLGTGNDADQYVPTAVQGVTGVSQISSGYAHTCAVLTDSTLKCWGRNQYGSLGDGTLSNSSVAVSVMAPPVTLASPTSITVTATASTAKSLDVSWDAVTGASSYTVKLYNAAGSGILATKQGIVATSTTIDTTTYGSIANNTAYKVTVTAIGDGGVNYNNAPESLKVGGTTNLTAATPTISSQPAAASRSYGQSVTFSVTASASDGGTLSYQWLLGGVSINGATSSAYTINPLALSDAGSYSVYITNSVPGGLPSSTTSNAATLSVSKASQASLSVTSTSGTYGSALTLTTSGGSGTGAVTYAVTAAGSAGCSISGGNTLNANSPGTCTVSATKATSTNYLAETSSATTVTFARQSQEPLSIATTSGDLYTGIIVSVLGGSGTGTVTSSVSSGTANCTLTSRVVSARSVGTCALTVTKDGDSLYLSESETFTLTFTKATPVQGSLTTPSAGTAGTGITLNFTGGSGTGTVSYTVASPGGAGCTIANGVLIATNAGTCTVAITRAADDTYASQSTNVEFTFTAGQSAVPQVAPILAETPTTTTAQVVTRGVSPTTTTTVSRSSTTTTTTLPKATPVPPSLTNTESAAGAATIGGKTEKATTERANNQLVFTAGGFTVTLAGLTPDGAVIPLSTDGILKVRRGDMFRLDAQGFAPQSNVDVWMFSKTMYLGKIEVSVDGLVKSTFKVPKSVDDGLHHLVMVGVDRAKKAAKFEIGVNVGVPPKQWWFSRILLIVPIGLAIIAGIWLPTTTSRRRGRAA
jgi:alpha-tubulin suppressor-like RCC1 family protein